MSVKMDRKKLNKKLKEIQKKAKTFEVGIFNPESARKGMLLNYGERGKQIARPWFSANMNIYNNEFKEFMTEVLEDFYSGKLSEKEAGQLMADFCKSGLDSGELKESRYELQEFTKLVKAGLLKRPDTGRRKASIEAAEKIGVDSGKMRKSITYKSRKTKR
jgi:hypothetical protein